jgi:metal-sulfur cluster biosynthetic enzyme
MDARIDQIIERLRDVLRSGNTGKHIRPWLIYNVDIDENNNAHIVMTLTAPGCPVADVLVEDVRLAALVPTIEQATVELTFDPPWDKSMMSEEARLELGFLLMIRFQTSSGWFFYAFHSPIKSK